MTNPLAETISMPVQAYTNLAAKYSNKNHEKSQQETPRAEALRAEIDVLIQKAQAKNLLLDDESVAKSTEAADIRKQLDDILPEFQSLAEATAKRLAMTKHFRERIQKALANPQSDIQVPLGEAMVLLEIAEPNFS